MKLVKLMLSASVAALAIVSCNKQDTTPVQNVRLKSIEVSLENLVLTKGDAGDKISAGHAVHINDVKIFLTDGNGTQYDSKVSDGSAPSKTYWSRTDLEVGILETADFHYVDPNCTRVVAVANLGKDASWSEVQALINIDNQQNQKMLVLYDSKELLAAGRQHNNVNQDGTTYVSEVYEAELMLTPRISRFEVDGFQVVFGDDPKFDEVNITQIAFQNYYPSTYIHTGEEAGHLVHHITDLANQPSVYGWLDDTNKNPMWYWDSFDLTITPANNKADTPKPLAYHFFSGKTIPVMIIKLLADGQPAYLYSDSFYYKNGEQVTELEEGKIYRMSAAGKVSNDGSVPIPEEKIDPMDRCLEITVDVIDWAVELIYPRF